MSKTQTFAKFAAVAAGFGLVASSFVPALAAAQTTTTSTSSSMSASQVASLQAQIAALQAQLAAASGSSMSASASMTFTRDLTIGSKGSDVTALQTWLIAKGFSVPAGATGYFGAQTKAALAAYQAANGISPAAGYFGAKTRAAVNASGSTTGGTTTGGTTTGGTTTGGSLSGGEGSLDNFKIVGASSTSLNAGQSNTVYGFEFKANGSDLMVNRVDYDIVNSNGTGATRPWNVFQTATLMHGNTTVATVDASNMSNYSQDGNGGYGGNTQVYRLRFDNLKDVVKMGTTADYYLTLSTQGVISSSNSGAQYTVNLTAQGVRATDAMGLQQYSSATAQSTASVSVSANTSGSLTISTGSDNPAVGTTVQANSNSQTSNVVLTTFTLQAKDADVMVYTLPTSVATTSATASTLIRDLKLYQGSTLIDTESFTTNAGPTSLTFKNLNIKIPQGTTQSFSVQADVNSVGGTTSVPEGSSIAVSIPNSGWDAENATGNNVPLTGSVTGNAITFRTVGLSFDTNPTTSATATAVGTSGTQQGNFTFTFNVTAFGQDIYFSKVGGTAVTGTVTSNGVATSTASSTALTSTADTSANGNYVVHSGQTKSVTVTVTIPGGSNAPDTVKLNTFNFGTSDSAVTASSTQFNSNYQAGPTYLHA